MMRIIAGKARGTKLNTLEGLNTRPTSERTKEAVFSMINFNIPESNVLDMFAGSGQMGLEALSRGATKATFIDQAKEAVAIVNQNVKKTHFENFSTVITSEFSASLKKLSGKERYDIVFVDPPYASDCLIKALKCLVEYDLLNEGAIIVCESGKEDIFEGDDKIKESFQVKKTSKYGVAYITILIYK